MSVESLITTYGYPVVFAGALVEGETIILTAGFLAHAGYLSLQWVVLLAFIGGFAGDQFYFHAGRMAGARLLERIPHWKDRFDRIHALFQRFDNLLVLSFRFFYGFRIATPVVIGMTGYSAKRFFILNGIGALIWASVIATAGYFFEAVLELLLADIRKQTKWIALGILAMGVVVWLVNSQRRGKPPQKSEFRSQNSE
jgi:membrane protein DedA with SNARE-associated domain